MPRLPQRSKPHDEVCLVSSGQCGSNKVGRRCLMAVALCLVVALSAKQLEFSSSDLSAYLTVWKNYSASWNGTWPAQSFFSTLKKADHFLLNMSANNRLHKANVAVLDLLDWEQASLQGLANANSTHPGHSGASCRPPDGIGATCCLGAYSTGGAVDGTRRHNCAHAFHGPENQWAKLQREVRQFFSRNPVPSGGMQCDVCQIVELARMRSVNISLVGDSMHHQVFDGLVCALARRGYKVVQELVYSQYPDGYDRFHNFGPHFYLTVESPTWEESVQPVIIAFHQLYKWPLASESKAEMTQILHHSQVLFLGLGLHWTRSFDEGPDSQVEDFVHSMGNLFQEAFSASSSVELLIERETTAQHFDVPGGDYREWAFDRDRGEATHQCVNRIGPATYWRERWLSTAKAKSTYQYERIVAGPDMPAHVQPREVVALPYHNFTQLFHKMHPLFDGLYGECTHYCASPFIYMTLWRSLRLAMDRQYLNAPKAV